MRDAARSLYEALRVLERRAIAARRKAGLSASRREAAFTAHRAPYDTEVDARRISSWLPEDPALAQVPRSGDADKVWALVRVWSGWAGARPPQRRYWMDLIEAAQPARIRKPAEDTTIRSTYLQQVGRIAPAKLIGREPELAELSRFCLEPDRGPYVWWQAGPWAGKSALLSTFVLRPPQEVRERIRVVSFFITARLAAQDTREAFTQVLLEQLAEMTGQNLPAVLPEPTREAYLLDLLAQAAATCQREAGMRLVLVVDGLDEDQSVIAGPHAHSIAALLPADPPHGLRLIVAGRPNPPIPDDVPGWHPLRDPEIICPLRDSPHAQDAQRLGRQELQRILHGTPVEQDLLGLLAAARGGLSGIDLEELTGAPLGEIEEVMHTVAGRTFTRRMRQHTPRTEPEVYLLGHEELHTAATRYLGRRLDGYRDRLHDWADTYRAKGWPPGTPSYLLSGYYRLLTDLRDLPRMLACAENAARHELLLHVTGGDAAALAEIRIALDFIADQDVPDLASALRLACHRDILTDRNISIPSGLPAVWALLGQVVRAEAMATSIPDLDRRAKALVLVAGVLAEAGQHEEAARIAGQAEAALRSIAGLDRRTEAMVGVAEVLARAGQYQQAEAVARSITSPHRQSIALARIAGTLAGAGRHEQAMVVARFITNPDQRAIALVRVAGTLAEAGQHEEVARFAAQAAEASSASIRVASSSAMWS